MFKLFKKNYYRITVQDFGLRSYYIIKAKNITCAELKFRKYYNKFAQIISIEKVEEK
jgi:hypothetical protein